MLVPFISSNSTVFAPAEIEGTVNVPFIASLTTLYSVQLPTVNVPFIASLTTLYAVQLPTVSVPFIASATVLYDVQLPVVALPFIASKTRVFGIFSLFGDAPGSGPGNGGELFAVRLAANGTSIAATLAATITADATLLELTGDAGLPTTDPFCLTIGSEVLYVVALGGGSYRIRGRGLSNTTPAAHTAGVSATWTDSYDMPIVAGADIAHEFTADITGSGSSTYPGWLICFDATQAYLAGGRYPMHVTQVLGVFDAGAGAGGTNRCDAAQPNAIATAAATSDDCPAALSNPSRIQTNILTGDVAVIRYTNPEASVLDLGSRSAALQSWFGLKRVDAAGTDVTFTDPNGIVVDTTGAEDTFTGSVNGEWHNPLGPGIAPDTGLPTNHDVPYTSVTLPGSDRHFTRTAEKGWPICALAVRQGNRRIPSWASFDWHNFNYVYAGFDVDATFCQLLINRNGILFGTVPSVNLPGTQDIDGPDVVWDDGSYYFAASWYVLIFAGPYLVAGPSIGGTDFSSTPPPDSVTPIVGFPGGPTGSPVVDVPTVEGGSGGGDIPPATADTELFQVALV